MQSRDGEGMRARGYESGRPDVLALVPEHARRVLDLGCSSGRLGAALKQRQGAVVVGIEAHEHYAKEARGRLENVLHADIEEVFSTDACSTLGTFDCIVAADVLEHLRDPWTALRRATRLLEWGGTAVVSLPNVRNWKTLRALLVDGRWPRAATGIFDETHLRWFTRSDAIELLVQAGLSPVKVVPKYPMGPRRDGVVRHLARTPVAPYLAIQYLVAGVHRRDPF